jgi:crotonobetainyl-CoA:carnitine CoA-transferase CaiB-like acyl-CoA transferase
LKTDPRFAGRQARKTNRQAMNQEIAAALSKRSAEEWENMLNAAGVPAGCVLGVPQVLRERQVAERRFVETLAAHNPAGEPLRVTRPGFRLDGDFPTPSPPPRLGANTSEWLSRLGYDAGAIARLQEAGIVLSAPEPPREAAEGDHGQVP